MEIEQQRKVLFSGLLVCALFAQQLTFSLTAPLARFLC